MILPHEAIAEPRAENEIHEKLNPKQPGYIHVSGSQIALWVRHICKNDTCCGLVHLFHLMIQLSNNLSIKGDHGDSKDMQYPRLAGSFDSVAVVGRVVA
jgi:hypothetical protein